MNQSPICIKRALISVSDKTHLEKLASGLNASNIEILSTGGTASFLREKKISVIEVETVTRFSEMMNGRVKTLHPYIHGAILGLRDVHAKEAEKHGIHWIDLVVVNLYPFSKTIQNSNVSLDQAVEQIDIGGPTLLRAAAKNMGWVCVMTDPNDYDALLNILKITPFIPFEMRKNFALKAFQHTAEYDVCIHTWLAESFGNQAQKTLKLIHKKPLRYGENPHQLAEIWQLDSTEKGILSATVLQGKPLSYNNMIDADAAFHCIRDFTDPTCVMIKHGTPCGMASAQEIGDAYQFALASDPVSAFGCIIAVNRTCDENLAKLLSQLFVEVLIVPAITDAAKVCLSKKNNLRILQIDFSLTRASWEFKFISGAVLLQTCDTALLNFDNCRVVTKTKFTPDMLKEARFAWQAVKHVKSNAIVITKNQATLGISGGQVSRIDAVEMALKKAGDKSFGALVASDAFFPFRDSIDYFADRGIKGIIQPGGSRLDSEVIAACNENNIAMLFTQKRCFKH